MSTLQSRAKTIFLQALELVTITEREAYLDTQCGTDADLRREVEQLLRHHGDVGSFLESPPTAVVDSAEQLHTIAPPSLEFLTPSSRADSLGRLGHYEILEVVGSGGMGIVLKAFDEQLHRIVAIKAMTPSLAASGTGRQRFVREAQAAAAVNHDNVIDIYAVEEAGPVPYLAMEYVAGISLEDKLKQEGPLELKEILRIGLQTADGLAAAHRQGLVHRDVKPANILLENGVGRVKVTDFGLARAADDVSVTQTGVIAGTPAYMSPEQARGEAVDHRSDLFSLGSVLYALCAGRTPFRGSTSLGVLKQVCEERPQPIGDLNPDIPDWLCAIIERLHAKLPAERLQSAAELAEVLGRYLAHVQQPSLPLPTAIVPVAAPHKPHTPNTAHKSRHDRRRWAVAAVAALVVLGVTLSLTDASGITHVAATVIRMFTPDGTLVVEVDDPGVKVTVEGDGGLVITGAGLEEIRLRPGSYKVHADKDGKRVPLERELVSITRGDRKIVRVKLEAADIRLTPTAERFTPLFNGKDLTGWAAAQGGTGMWKIEDGALTCTGPSDHLLTTRNDFGDFHLRAEVKINANGNSGIYFRASKPLVLIGDYEAQITNNPGQQYKTGALFRLVGVSESPVPPETWFTLEIIAVGKRIRILVNGQETAHFTEDRAGRNTHGHIALQHWDAETRVFFRKVEVKELPLGNATADGAFVLLGGKGVAERNFDTLAEAVQSASDGDTVEIRGNGPFVTEPMKMGKHALSIRSGDGFRPLIQLSPEGSKTAVPMLRTEGPLVLEGVEWQRRVQDSFKWSEFSGGIISSSGSSLHVANCRFHMEPGGSPVCIYSDAPLCTIVNCQFLCKDRDAVWGSYPSSQARTLENSIHIGKCALGSVYQGSHQRNASIRLVRNTFVARTATGIRIDAVSRSSNADQTVKPIQMDVAETIFDASYALTFCVPGYALPKEKVLEPGVAEGTLRRVLDWRDRRNLYGLTDTILFLEMSEFVEAKLASTPRSLADWNRFWSASASECVEGRVRYQGGDLFARLDVAPEQLTPEDFRLRPDSAGYKAGKDGKDLGADIDLVGPGPAYERWKKTPEYQVWLKDTGQLRADIPQPEAGAFVCLGGKGVTERKFDTLAEAVLGSSKGDTIEVRGNGPFVSDGVTTRHPLVIRAGAGFAPSITLSKASADRNFPLVTALDALVLEGLELRRMGGAAGQVEDRQPLMLLARQRGSLHVANCRLIYKGDSPQWEQGALLSSQAGSLSVRNSVLSGNIGTEAGGFCESGRRYDIENCVCAVGGIGFSPLDPNVRDVSIRVRRNTFVGNCLNLTLFSKPNLPTEGEANPPIRLEISANVARWDATIRNTGFLYFHQAGLKEPFSAAQAEGFLPRFVRLDEKQNVYRPGTPMLSLVADWNPLEGTRGQDLADWDRFWGQQNTGSVEGEIRFQGGDLVTRARTAPELITAADFRLRPDSAGYKAGKDGKDLGADIDLVGPGPAYERWKKTPEYQEWLKETGHFSGQ